MNELHDIFRWGEHMMQLSGWGILLAIVAIIGIASLFEGSVRVVRIRCSRDYHRGCRHRCVADDDTKICL